MLRVKNIITYVLGTVKSGRVWKQFVVVSFSYYPLLFLLKIIGQGGHEDDLHDFDDDVILPCSGIL